MPWRSLTAHPKQSSLNSLGYLQYFQEDWLALRHGYFNLVPNLGADECLTNGRLNRYLDWICKGIDFDCIYDAVSLSLLALAFFNLNCKT